MIWLANLYPVYIFNIQKSGFEYRKWKRVLVIFIFSKNKRNGIFTPKKKKKNPKFLAHTLSLRLYLHSPMILSLSLSFLVPKPETTPPISLSLLDKNIFSLLDRIVRSLSLSLSVEFKNVLFCFVLFFFFLIALGWLGLVVVNLSCGCESCDCGLVVGVGVVMVVWVLIWVWAWVCLWLWLWLWLYWWLCLCGFGFGGGDGGGFWAAVERDCGGDGCGS